MRQSAEVEAGMVNFERITQIVKLKPEADLASKPGGHLSKIGKLRKN